MQPYSGCISHYNLPIAISLNESPEWDFRFYETRKLLLRDYSTMIFFPF